MNTSAHIINHTVLLTSDKLQNVVNVMRNTRDADRWNAVEWLRLYEAYHHCGWDYTPDVWSTKQVKEALAKNPRFPAWDDNYVPMAGGPFKSEVKL